MWGTHEYNIKNKTDKVFTTCQTQNSRTSLNFHDNIIFANNINCILLIIFTSFCGPEEWTCPGSWYVWQALCHWATSPALITDAYTMSMLLLPFYRVSKNMEVCTLALLNRNFTSNCFHTQWVHPGWLFIAVLFTPAPSVLLTLSTATESHGQAHWGVNKHRSP